MENCSRVNWIHRFWAMIIFLIKIPKLGARSKLSTFVSAGVTRKAFDSSVHLTCAVSFTLLFLYAPPQQSTRATTQLVNQKTKQHQTQIRNNKQQDKYTKIGPIWNNEPAIHQKPVTQMQSTMHHPNVKNEQRNACNDDESLPPCTKQHSTLLLADNSCIPLSTSTKICRFEWIKQRVLSLFSLSGKSKTKLNKTNMNTQKISTRKSTSLKFLADQNSIHVYPKRICELTETQIEYNKHLCLKFKKTKNKIP